MVALPDSRLHDRNMETVMGDWELMDGSTVRIEVSPVFCASCGLKYGYVPKENTTFACFLCNQCFEQYGEVAATYVVPEHEFNLAVQHEMQARFGKDLTDLELFKLLEHGELGHELELLAKESPYKVMNA